jgi:Holliday junction resolvase RusA-like endonuclease
MDFEFNVEGALKSKANSRQLVKRGGRTISIKSNGALDYEKFAVLQLQQQAKKQKIKPIADTVGLELEIFYPSRRNDLSPELFFDCLQKAGILVNDRQIIEYRCAKHVDKINPRVECVLYIIGEKE